MGAKHSHNFVLDSFVLDKTEKRKTKQKQKTTNIEKKKKRKKDANKKALQNYLRGDRLFFSDYVFR